MSPSCLYTAPCSRRPTQRSTEVQHNAADTTGQRVGEHWTPRTGTKAGGLWHGARTPPKSLAPSSWASSRHMHCIHRHHNNFSSTVNSRRHGRIHNCQLPWLWVWVCDCVQRQILLNQVDLKSYDTTDGVNVQKMEELPKAFVGSLRVLFEILDENSDGFVELREIEKRWQGDSVTGLPAGVVDSLRSIAPKDGRLSFDRFCTGLKITLEKHRSTSKGRQVQVRGSRNSKEDKQPTTATVRPNNVVHPMRSKSAPQLQDLTSNPRQLRNSRSSTSMPDEKKGINPPDYASHIQKTKDKSRRLSDKSEELVYSKHQSRNDDYEIYEPSIADRKHVEATLKSWQQEKKHLQIETQQQRKSEPIYEKRSDQSNYAKPPSYSGEYNYFTRTLIFFKKLNTNLLRTTKKNSDTNLPVPYMGQNFERCTIGHFQTLSTSITPGSPPVTQKPFLLVSS